MEHLRIQGANRRFGGPGYFTIHVREGETVNPETGQRYTTMSTAWQPTPEELAALNRGAPLILEIGCTVHPPIRLSVGEIGGS